MNIQVFMLSGQNNGEKDVLRAYYRGVIGYMSDLLLGTETNDLNLTENVKKLRKEHNIYIDLNYTDAVKISDVDVGVIFGSGKPRENLHHLVRNRVKEHAKNHIVIETPLLNRKIVKASTHDYYRIGLNGFLNGQGEFNNEQCDNKRRTKLKLDSIPSWNYDKNGYILLLLQLPGDASLRESNHGEWVLETVDNIRKITDRTIKLRFHPGMSEKGHELFFGNIGQLTFRNYKNILWSDGKDRTLQEDLSEAKVCVSYSSGSSIDAVLAGVPNITIDEGNFAYPISSKDISAIENPIEADDAIKSQWINDLSYCQWNREEMSSGEAFSHIYPKIEELLQRDKNESS